ncbi:MAG TPA: DMT family transporter [Nitrospiria bacterium]|nr:DMT family transporter [Nitrospiria bacterium]
MTRRYGMAIMLLAATCIGIQAFFVKVATQYTGPAEIAFLRFLFSFLIIQVAITGGWIEVRVVNWRMVLARGVLGGIGNLLYFYAIEATRLSNAIILLYTYPIFASLYTQMMYRQGLGVSTVGAFLISFAGISLIVDPTFQDIQRGDLLALLSGAMVGGAIFSLRESRRTDSAWTIFHYFNIMGMALSIPLMEIPWKVPGESSVFPLAGVVVFSMLGQLLMTYAYRYCTAAEGGILSMFGAVVGCGLGILILGEAATPGFMVGSLLVVLSGIYLILQRSEASGQGS